MLDDLKKFLESFDCPISVEIHEPCKPGHIEFNNDAPPRLFQWDGSREELEEWMKTPWGALSMVQARRVSRVYINVLEDGVILDLWPGVTTVE